MNNPDSKTIDIKTQAGLDLLKMKAEYYGHYAEHLKVAELISEIEELRKAALLIKLKSPFRKDSP
jgi:hypothetical protein